MVENETLIAPTQPLKLSVSKSKTWSHCKKQFQYSYIIKLPKVDRDYHLFGKILHKALEDFHQLYIKGWLLPANEAMKVSFQAAKAEFANKMTPEAVKDAFDILCQYLKMVASKPPTYLTNVKSTEEAFNFPLTDDIILNGFIDKIEIDPDGLLHISDYKSTKDKRYLKDDWFQLLTYAFVIMTRQPELEQVRVSYVLLRHDFERISRVVSREEVMAIKERYLAYAADIVNAKEYPANPTRLCGWCDFLDHCVEGKRVVGKQTTHGEIDW
jgi:putative RecB family exonuclease